MMLDHGQIEGGVSHPGGARLIVPRIIGDARGFFCETYRKDAFDREFGAADFVQDNHSLSKRAGTLRGLHYQLPPMAQGKLVRVVRGAVFDVAVDIRHGSPTYGRYQSAVLSAYNHAQSWGPLGCAHGFSSPEPDTEVVYKVTAYYSAAHDCGILWNDPDLAIDWPAEATDPTMSDKDARLPRLKDAPVAFTYEPA